MSATNLPALREVNFRQILDLNVQDPARYTLEAYHANGNCHPEVRAYCVSCEEKGLNTAWDSEDFRLTYISHGAHSSDFLMATGVRGTKEWHDQPVMFVCESPSVAYGLFTTEPVPCRGVHKHPARKWYWVERVDPQEKEYETASFPDSFCKMVYGPFVLCAIQIFRLANAYVTNLVKCSLNNSEGKFRNLGHFREECVRNCAKEILQRELKALWPRVVFAMGAQPAYWLRRLREENLLDWAQVPVYELPHPTGRFKGGHRLVLNFWTITKALHDVGIISLDEERELLSRFLGTEAKQFTRCLSRR